MPIGGIDWIEAHRKLRSTDDEFVAHCDRLNATVRARIEAHQLWPKFSDFVTGGESWEPARIMDLFLEIAAQPQAPAENLLVYSGIDAQLAAEKFVIENPDFNILETTARGAMLFEGNPPELVRQGRIPEEFWRAPGYVSSALTMAEAKGDIYTFNACEPRPNSTFRLWEIPYILGNERIANILHPREPQTTPKWQLAEQATGNLDLTHFRLRDDFARAARPCPDGLQAGLDLDPAHRHSYLLARRHMPGTAP